MGALAGAGGPGREVDGIFIGTEPIEAVESTGDSERGVGGAEVFVILR